MGLAVGPHAGANTVVIGDAGGSINPFNGEGIAYAYETGRLAAAAVAEALRRGGHGRPGRLRPGDPRRLRRLLQGGPGLRHLISNPAAMRLCVGAGMRSEFVMSQLLRIMANLMRPDTLGPAETAYRAMELVSTLLPDISAGGRPPG